MAVTARFMCCCADGASNNHLHVNANNFDTALTVSYEFGAGLTQLT